MRTLGRASILAIVCGCGDQPNATDGGDTTGEATSNPSSTTMDASGSPTTAGEGPGTTAMSATGSPTTSSGPSDDSGTAGTTGEPSGEWLHVDGNMIVHADGTPFHGRGANLHDERSCNACSFAPPLPDGIDRWADELIDDWHANFIRFDLSSKAAPYNEYEQQWMNLVDDDVYFADIVQNVEHMASKPGVYIMVTLFADPTMKENNDEFDSEWPSSLGDSNTRYTKLAEAFYDNPRVLFGLTNEPHTSPDHEAELAAVYVDAIAAIRGVEDGHGTPHHIIVVQAPQGWARDLSYFVANPLDGDEIAYEVHPYNHATDFDMLLVQPHQTLPIVIGEYGPADGYMDDSDIMQLWQVAQDNEIPHIAWAFHMRCPPNLLEDSASDGCGLDAATGYDFPRTAWGDLLFDYLATPW